MIGGDEIIFRGTTFILLPPTSLNAVFVDGEATLGPAGVHVEQTEGMDCV